MIAQTKRCATQTCSNHKTLEGQAAFAEATGCAAHADGRRVLAPPGNEGTHRENRNERVNRQAERNENEAGSGLRTCWRDLQLGDRGVIAGQPVGGSKQTPCARPHEGLASESRNVTQYSKRENVKYDVSLTSS